MRGTQLCYTAKIVKVINSLIYSCENSVYIGVYSVGNISDFSYYENKLYALTQTYGGGGGALEGFRLFANFAVFASITYTISRETCNCLDMMV